jgi:glycerophosphoryl diester phosphodiesterase
MANGPSVPATRPRNAGSGQGPTLYNDAARRTDDSVPALSPAARSPDRPLVFAHRGGRALGPENTILAFDLGLATGADGLELDVHLSGDEQAIVCHDATLDRTTDASGALSARSAHELSVTNAARRYGIDLELEWQGGRAGVPTLSAVLERYPAAAVIVELKDDRPELAHAVVKAIDGARAADRVCVGSFSTSVLSVVRAVAPHIPTSAGREEAQWVLYRSWLGLGPGRTAYRAFQVPEQSGRLRVVTPGFVRRAHRWGLAVQVWTVNEEADMWRLLDWGVDGLITDHPGLALDVRDDWVKKRRG